MVCCATEKQLSARLAAELIAAEAKHNSGDWKSTLERVVPAIVSLKLNSPKVWHCAVPVFEFHHLPCGGGVDGSSSTPSRLATAPRRVSSWMRRKASF